MRHRVFTYITRGDELLVLDHLDGSYTEPQIPGGTVKDGESPEHAALREAQEETGLRHLEIVALLGSFSKELSEIGRDETIMAWFFHLRTRDRTPASWRHFEMDPSEVNSPVPLLLYWVPMTNIPALGGIDSVMLPALRLSMADDLHS